MAKNLLYFPYINVPRNEWTLRSLIYYDTIHSIVPDEYFYEPERYELNMLEFVRENLVIPLNPVQVLDRPYVLVEPFLNFVDRPGYRTEAKRHRFRDNYRHINAQKIEPWGLNGQ